MGLSHNPKIVTDGLVLCLDAANPKSYPGSGTTWSDLSKNGNNGTLINGLSYSGDNNGSLTFDGSSDYVSVPFSSSYTVNNDHTIMIWVKSDSILTTANNNRVTPFKNSSGVSSWNPGLWYHGGTIRGHTTGKYTDLSWTQDTNWHMMGQIYYQSTNTLKIILDGVIYDGTSTTNYTPQSDATNTLYLGNPITTSTVYFSGNFSSFQAYNRALTESEIKQNFAATRGRYGI